MRKLIGSGKPRRLQGLFASIDAVILTLWNVLANVGRKRRSSDRAIENWARFQAAM